MTNKCIQYNHTDAEALKKRFTKLNPETVDRLCEWLKANNAVVNAEECYDGRSGWSGVDFMIGKANLSLNGYCLSNIQVELFINGGKNPDWYHSWEPEYKEAKEWQTQILNKIKNK